MDNLKIKQKYLGTYIDMVENWSILMTRLKLGRFFNFCGILTIYKLYMILIKSYLLRVLYLVIKKSFQKFPIFKGQLISKGVLMSSISSKKRTKEFDFTTMIPQIDLFSFVFWRKSKTPKNHFEVIWPLVLKPEQCNQNSISVLTWSKIYITTSKYYYSH